MMLYSTYKKNIAALFLGCIFLCGCENTKQEIDSLNKKNTNVEEATIVTLNYTLGGKAKAILTAPLMLRVQNDTMPYVEFPKKIHVDFYNDSTKIESILDAKYARYIESQSKILLRDSVRFIGLKNGDTLYCNELYWDRNRPVYQFYTESPTQVRTKLQNINSVGFETSQDFKDKNFKQVTNSSIKVPSSQFPEY
jgi:LPS export ABC transporter protein LptC